MEDLAEQPSGPGVGIDRARRTADAEGRLLDLTRREFDLLAHLVAHPQRVFTRTQLLREVWQQPDVGDGRTVDVHMTRLRHKLGADHRALLVTVRGVGYTYEPPVAANSVPPHP